MAVFDTFEEIRLNRHRYAQEWKARTEGKVVGSLCTYVPEELLYAAGVLPVRIYGSHEPTDITEPHISSQWCPFSRDCLAQGLDGRYDYLDGVVHAFSCAHMFNCYNSWWRHVPNAFHHDIYVPEHLANPHALTYFEQELRQFQGAIEKWLGKPIATADLDRAIGVYNTSSRLMKEVYATRQHPNPPITGAEAMAMVLASSVMDKAEHNRLLEQALEEVSQRPGIAEPGVRLMLLGSENDDVDFIRFIEGLGTTVVIDEHCTGSRYFWQEIPSRPDGLAAIAQRYHLRPPCAHKDVTERRRFHHIKKLAADYQVQGVIFILEKFCDIYEFEIPPMQKMLQGLDIPMLVLEVDVTVPYGQFRTRIEAFLETLALEVV